MTRIETRALLIAALKEKQNSRDYLLITDNNRNVVKKNTEHNYLIKKYKLDLNKKKNCILCTSSVRLLPGKITSKSTSWLTV